MEKITAVVLGYGNRGSIYSDYALTHPEQLQIVAVADPLENRRMSAKRSHRLEDHQLFESWDGIARQPKMADIAIITTQDAMHCEQALAMIEKGYDLLLEKPMAITARDCKRICQAAQTAGVKVVVCHVLRFTGFWRRIKDLLDDGALGKVMSVIHMENVGNLHQSHSFVRGNWRRTEESAPMILAKCCHDMDMLQWLIGGKCTKIQSFGGLSCFTPENRPAGAPDRCTDGCPAAEECFYNAIKFYHENKKNFWRPTVANTVDWPTDEAVMEALKHGPYGRCVYSCDNDVVDHQVVNMSFEGGCTVSFTMNAFNQGGRFIRIFGTEGELEGRMDSEEIRLYSFRDKTWHVIPLEQKDDSGHGGGDTGILEKALPYFAGAARDKGICDIDVSCESHLLAFAAEASRLENRVVDMKEFEEKI